jgi:hypothetical protein
MIAVRRARSNNVAFTAGRNHCRRPYNITKVQFWLLSGNLGDKTDASQLRRQIGKCGWGTPIVSETSPVDPELAGLAKGGGYWCLRVRAPLGASKRQPAPTTLARKRGVMAEDIECQRCVNRDYWTADCTARECPYDRFQLDPDMLLEEVRAESRREVGRWLYDYARPITDEGRILGYNLRLCAEDLNLILRGERPVNDCQP